MFFLLLNQQDGPTESVLDEKAVEFVTLCCVSHFVSCPTVWERMCVCVCLYAERVWNGSSEGLLLLI